MTMRTVKLTLRNQYCAKSITQQVFITWKKAKKRKAAVALFHLKFPGQSVGDPEGQR